MAALLVAGISGGSLLVMGDPGRREDIELAVQSPLGLIALFVLSAVSTATLILPIPGMALTALAATAAPPLLVGVVAGAGQVVGELTGYVAGASGTLATRNRLASSRLAHRLRQRGSLTLFLLALVPNPAFDMAGILAGAIRVPVSRFLLVAGLGKILRNVLIAWVAAQSSLVLSKNMP